MLNLSIVLLSDFSAPMNELNKTLNPTTTHRLDCSVESFLPGDAVVTYSWTQNGVDLAGEEEKTLEIGYDNSTEVSEEEYSCTAEPNIQDLDGKLLVSQTFRWIVSVIITLSLLVLQL